MNFLMPEIFMDKYQNFKNQEISSIKLIEELGMNLITT